MKSGIRAADSERERENGGFYGLSLSLRPAILLSLAFIFFPPAAPRHVFCAVDLGWLDKFDPYPFRFALP